MVAPVLNHLKCQNYLYKSSQSPSRRCTSLFIKSILSGTGCASVVPRCEQSLAGVVKDWSLMTCKLPYPNR